MAKARVLAVDDQRYFRELIEGLLAEGGYAVQTASSAEEALHRLEREDFDIVVTDLVMPGIDGAELCRRIKQRKPDQDIVMITGVVDVQTAVDAMKLGATDYLLKPFDRETLVGALDAIRKQRRLREEHARLVEENLEYLGALSLYERATGLFQTLGLAALAERAVEGLCIETRAQGGVVWMADDLEREAPLALAGVRGLLRVENEPKQLDPNDLSHDVVAALARGRARIGSDGELGTVLWVPLEHAGQLLGVVRLSDKLEGEAFGELDRLRAEKLAGFAALAAANTLRFRALERRSFRDPVTKTYTRAYFQDVVHNEIQKAARFAREFSLLRLRLDDAIERRRSTSQTEHARWLEACVQRASQALRATDILATEGDDAFSVLLPETDSLAAAALAARVRTALAESGAAGPVSTACATFPADGTRAEMLERVLATRLAASAESLAPDVERHTLAGALDALLARGRRERADQRDAIAELVMRAVACQPHERAFVLYAVPEKESQGVRAALDDAIGELDRRASTAGALRTELVLAGPHVDAREADGPTAVVRAPGGRVGRCDAALIALGDGPSYAFVAGAEARDGTLAFFHTDDRALVEQLAVQARRELGMAVAE
ncbi:MAG: response regulator [Myxococcales bacterium]|nr:response regulator [Myxococcales bacterium]